MSPKFYTAYSPFGGGWFVFYNDQGGVQRSACGPFDAKIDADMERDRLNLESGMSYLSGKDST